MKTSMEELAPYMRGWRSYFGFGETPEVLDSIFQSKDDPETEFRFQSSVILKNVIEEAAKRADLLSWFLVLKTDKPRSSSHAPRGKVGNLILVFHFPIRGMPGCGNVGISRLWRDSQGAVERGEKLLLLFHAFHGPGISIALRAPQFVPRGSADSLLQRRSSTPLAAAIFRAHSVSLIFCATASSRAKLIPSFKYFSASGKLFHFSYGVA